MKIRSAGLVVLALATRIALLPASASAFSVTYDYYVFASSSDGIPIMDDQVLQDQVHTDGAYAKFGAFDNCGTASFVVDLMDRSVGARGYSHGVKPTEWPYFASGTGRVEAADFYDRVTFTVPAGDHPDGLYATMTGYVRGTVASDVGAGAQVRCMAYLGPRTFDTGTLSVGIDTADSIVFDENFTLILELVAPGTTLNHDADFIHDVRLGLWNGRAWSVDYNTGSGYVTGDGTFDFTDGLRITSLTASEGVRFVSQSGAFSDGVTGVPDAGGTALHQNWPNPLNPETTIAFDLPRAMPVSLRVYDVAGGLVAVVLDGQPARQGRNEVVWRGCDRHGRALPSGSYFYRLEAGRFGETKRMTIVK